MSRKIEFESEYVLHQLTQKHLGELFGLEFVASEIQLKGLRFDNLAFDPKANSFVIIEYKNDFNPNVLNQVKDYYNILQNHREFFIDRLENAETVDFKNTRAMIIGPKLTQDQINKAKDNMELWKVTLFDDGKVNYENLRDNEIKTLEINLDELKLTEEMLLEDKSSEIKDLYCNLKNKTLNQFEDIDVKILVNQVAFKVNNKLICIVDFRKSFFNIFIHADNLENVDNIEDISDKSTGARAKYKLKYESDDDFDCFISIFEEVYNQKVDK